MLRPGGLVRNVNADGKPFRVPALPIEWNGSNIGEGLKVPVLGADTGVRPRRARQGDFTPTTPREAIMTRYPGYLTRATASACAKWDCATGCSW